VLTHAKQEEECPAWWPTDQVEYGGASYLVKRYPSQWHQKGVLLIVAYIEDCGLEEEALHIPDDRPRISTTTHKRDDIPQPAPSPHDQDSDSSDVFATPAAPHPNSTQPMGPKHRRSAAWLDDKQMPPKRPLLVTPIGVTGQWPERKQRKFRQRGPPSPHKPALLPIPLSPRPDHGTFGIVHRVGCAVGVVPHTPQNRRWPPWTPITTPNPQ
jgi:hypothetical protein